MGVVHRRSCAMCGTTRCNKFSKFPCRGRIYRICGACTHNNAERVQAFLEEQGFYS